MNADDAGQPRQRRIGLAIAPPGDPVGVISDTAPASSGSPASSQPGADPDEPSSSSPLLPPGMEIPSPPSVDPNIIIPLGPTIPVDSSVQLTRPGDPIGPGHHAEFSPDGGFAAVYHVGDGRVRLWNIDKGLAEPVSVLLDGVASAGTFSPDSCQLATGDTSGVVRVWDLCGPYPPAAPSIWVGHAITVTAVAYSRDGRWLATAADRPLTATATESEDVKLWSIDENQTSAAPLVLENDTYTSHLDFSADGHWLLASADEKHLRVWPISNLGEVERNTEVKPVLTQETDRFATSRDGRWLISAQNNEATSTSSGGFVVTFFRLEPESQQPELVRECSFSGWAGWVTVSQDGRWAAVTQEGGNVMLLDTASANPCGARTVKAPGGGRVEALFSPDARWLAARAEPQQVAFLWQLPLTADQAEPVVLYGHDALISAAAFSADSRWLATGGTDGEVRLWDLASGAIGAALPVTFEKGNDPCDDGCKNIVTPNSKWIATPYLRENSEGIGFWEIGLQARSEPAFLCRREPDFWGLLGIADMVYNSGAGLLAIQWWTGDVDLFDVDIRNRACAHRVTLGQNNWPWPDTTPLGFSRDGHWLVLQDAQNAASRLWSMAGDLNAGTVSCSTSSLPDGASPEGQVLLGGSLVAWGSDGSGATWCRERILDPAGTSVASANQLWGAIGDISSVDSEVDLWNLDFAAPHAIRRLSGLGSSGGVLAIDNSGRWFAQQESDGFSLYQLDPDGVEMPPVLVQPGLTEDAAFSENGRWFAAVNDEGAIRIWDIKGLGRLTPLFFRMDPGGTQTGEWTGASVSFSPDSQWLIGYSTTGIKLWPLAAQTWIDQACQVAARPMTPTEMWLHLGDMSGSQICLE